LVSTISHAPTFAEAGISKVQVTLEDELKVHVVAVILVSPERLSRAVRLEMKSDPVISVDTIVPASPSSGSIILIAGREADAVVVVAVAAVVALLVAVVVTTGVAVVGAAVGTDETVTCVILMVYTFSITVRGDVSVLAFIRYPHVPSVFW
jgi:hypothetical protein